MSTARLAIILLAALPAVAGPTQLLAENQLLHDFELDTEGWENEAAKPVPLRLTNDQAHHGQLALAVDYTFSHETPTLQCRVKEGYPRDFSKQPGFTGFSAWVYLPKRDKWEVILFVRSGPAWTWTTGTPIKPRKKGWFRVEIPKDQIRDVAQVQDIGLQVRYGGTRPLPVTLCFDQVEAAGK